LIELIRPYKTNIARVILIVFLKMTIINISLETIHYILHMLEDEVHLISSNHSTHNNNEYAQHSHGQFDALMSIFVENEHSEDSPIQNVLEVLSFKTFISTTNQYPTGYEFAKSNLSLYQVWTKYLIVAKIPRPPR